MTKAGFNRKPLAVILRELEDLNISEFGAEVIQTLQSPLGHPDNPILAMENTIKQIEGVSFVYIYLNDTI